MQYWYLCLEQWIIDTYVKSVQNLHICASSITFYLLSMILETVYPCKFVVELLFRSIAFYYVKRDFSMRSLKSSSCLRNFQQHWRSCSLLLRSNLTLSMCLMFSIKTHSIGNTGIFSRDLRQMSQHLQPYSNQFLSTKFTASPIFKPVLNPAW